MLNLFKKSKGGNSTTGQPSQYNYPVSDDIDGDMIDVAKKVTIIIGDDAIEDYSLQDSEYREPYDEDKLDLSQVPETHTNTITTY